LILASCVDKIDFIFQEKAESEIISEKQDLAKENKVLKVEIEKMREELKTVKSGQEGGYGWIILIFAANFYNWFNKKVIYCLFVIVLIE
jgi:hypothetical protein